MDGLSARIGLLWPADGRNDREFWQWLPDDVALLIARYDVGGTLDLEQLERDAHIDAIIGATHLLRHARPGVIAMGDCAGSFINGKGGNERQTRAVEQATGTPAVTMSTALVEALRHLSADRVAVLSPYAPDVTDRFRSFLSEHDIVAGACRSIDRASEREIDAMGSADWQDEARRADVEAATALAVAGGGVSLSAIVNDLERDLAKPVVTGPGALMWAALGRLGRSGRREDRGALFRTGA